MSDEPNAVRSARVGAGPSAVQALMDVPPSIGPGHVETLGVGWVMVRCPRQYDELTRRAGSPHGKWLVERRLIEPVIRSRNRTVDPLFRQAGPFARRRPRDATVLPLTSSEERRSCQHSPCTQLPLGSATLVTDAARAQETAHRLRAKAQQTIIDSECRATKLALIEDKEAWRVYRRQLGLRRADFVPYLT